MFSSIEHIDNFAEGVAESVSAALGGNFEIVLFDMKQPDHPVRSIFGKNISGTKAGDGGKDENLGSVFAQCRKENRFYKSEKKIIHGREMRSTIIFMMVDGTNPAAALKVNFDLSAVSVMEGFLKECGIIGNDKQPSQELINLDIRDLLPLLLKQGIRMVGKDVADMSKDDKLKIVKFLDDRGAYLLRSSIEDVAKALDITRFTVYNYLDEIRKTGNG